MAKKTSRPEISVQDRKLLWGKAGNRCAICKRFLINIEDNDQKGVVTGIECHIVGHSENGPRGRSDLPKSERHKYENIILLCMEHAKTIDERTGNWSVEKLKQVKLDHERAMFEIKSFAPKVSPKIKLVEYTGKSSGGPHGHFIRFTIRNFGSSEAIDLKSWVEGWNFRIDLQDPTNRSYLDEKQTIEYELSVEGTKVFTEVIPYLKFFSSYSNLEGESIIYSSTLKQEPLNEIWFDIKRTSQEDYYLTDQIEFNSMILKDSFGDYEEAEFTYKENTFSIRISKSLLSIWQIPAIHLPFCFRDVGRANVRVMSKLGFYENKDYSTYSFDDATQIPDFNKTIELIAKGEL